MDAQNIIITIVLIIYSSLPVQPSTQQAAKQMRLSFQGLN
jgi:hypothetical protein